MSFVTLRVLAGADEFTSVIELTGPAVTLALWREDTVHNVTFLPAYADRSNDTGRQPPELPVKEFQERCGTADACAISRSRTAGLHTRSHEVLQSHRNAVRVATRL
ncbi:hypothetical protein NE236_37105 [Actinoallomurus purpureus]|uniref:hypothetical protein n=1 Tax=Actinoallomurus purpureus TaxID=478114 RepID=UPI002091ED61|nr:hypothetical protein [Actinoallomurus purpureus]MCO6010591.1 hypothetical protein [Actinoallomurus purpureus]